MILGTDLSRWQGETGMSAARFDALDALGVKFAFLRATLATTYVDPSFQPNRERALARGWLTGAYAFCYRGDGAAQARHFVDAVKARGGLDDCLMAVDAEWSGKPTGADVVEFAKAFRIAAPGHPLLLYTASGYWGGIGNPNVASLFDGLWDARWTGQSPPNLPSTPPTGGYGGFPRGAGLWQWGPLRALGYIHDGDAWYGSLAELAALGNPSGPAVGDDVATIGYDKSKPRIVTVVKGAHLYDNPGQATTPATPTTGEERDEDWLGWTPDKRYHLVSAILNGVKRTAYISIGAIKGGIRPRPTTGGHTDAELAAAVAKAKTDQQTADAAAIKAAQDTATAAAGKLTQVVAKVAGAATNIVTAESNIGSAKAALAEVTAP